MSKFEREIAGITEGTAAVEFSDSQAVSQAFGDLSHAAGADAGFSLEEMNGIIPSKNAEQLQGVFEQGVDAAQSVALPLATVLIMYAGFKKMFIGLASKRSRA